MQIITDPHAFQAACLEFGRQGLTSALVPTMGALHEGHKSLMDAGRPLADKLLVTIFVNPTQFGPGEDFNNYPRDFSHDCELARASGADVLFAPENAAMYAPDHATWVEAPALAETLCGASRPGHFRGVCTVVLKLFNLARPTFALFGEKDRQQLCIIKKMAADLNLPLEVRGCPTVREADGLALSSRNKNLTEEERRQAPHIIKGLRLVEETPKAWNASVTLYVARPSQKGMVIGPKGRNLKYVRQCAEPELSDLFGVKVTLELWVKIEKDWMKNFWLLQQMGYAGSY